MELSPKMSKSKSKNICVSNEPIESYRTLVKTIKESVQKSNKDLDGN
jgi:hypothetical protein